MSVPFKASEVLNFALLQSAAECYLDGVNDRKTLEKILKEGANKAHLQGKNPSDSILSSATRFTDRQIDWFTRNYEIVTHYPNDNTGFSCTLFRNKESGEYTLSFRSTEFQPRDKGGDYERDGKSAADGDISDRGFALPNCQAWKPSMPICARAGI